MSLLSEASRQAHARWSEYRSPGGEEKALAAHKRRFFERPMSGFKRMVLESRVKTYAVVAGVPGAAVLGGGTVFWSLWDTMMATGDIGVLGMGSLIVAGVGMVGMAAAPLGIADVSDDYRRFMLDGAAEETRSARRDYFSSVQKDLARSGYVILSSDESTGSFTTHRGVIVLAEAENGEPTLLMNGKVLMNHYDDISSKPARTMTGFNSESIPVR